MKLSLFLNIGQKNNLLYSNFKSLNKKISKVGLGCVTFGREITEDESIRLLDVAVENGINLFNSGEAYIFSWMTNIAYVPQNPYLINGSLEENIKLLNLSEIIRNCPSTLQNFKSPTKVWKTEGKTELENVRKNV